MGFSSTTSLLLFYSLLPLLYYSAFEILSLLFLDYDLCSNVDVPFPSFFFESSAFRFL